MRHLIGVFLAIVMAGVLAAGAWGYVRLTALAAHLSRQAGGGPLISDHSARVALLAVAGAGLLAGILVAAPRVSPLAPGLPGLVLLGVTALYVLGTRHVAGLLPVPSGVSGKGLGTMVYGGIAGAAGLVMTMPAFIPSRWRARASAAAAAAAGSGEVTAGLPEAAETPEQAGAGHARLVSPAAATGVLPSRMRSGPQPPRGTQPGTASGADEDDRGGWNPWPGSSGQARPASVRLNSPWRLPDA